MNILVSVKNKIASLVIPECIVCGNSDYTITFDFDDEWSAETIKTARFVYRKSGENKYEDVAFSGNTVNVPVLSGITTVFVGVYAGELRTTTPAVIACEKSILCGGGTHEEPPEDIYNQILAACNELVANAATKEYVDSTTAPANHVKKTFFSIPNDVTAIVNFSGTTNAMIYCRGWAFNLSSVINYTGYAGGSARQSLDVLVGGQVYCGLLPESMGQGLAIRNVSSNNAFDVCIDGELQNNPPTITFTTEAIDGLSNAETFTRVGHAHTEYAPAGYGLGMSATSVTDLNTALNCGFFAWGSDCANAPFSYGMGIALNRFNGRYTQLLFNPHMSGSGEIVVRHYDGSNWLPDEWMNPPMAVGVEYRTTERWLGMPVYRRMVRLGWLAAGSHSFPIEDVPVTSSTAGVDILMYNNDQEFISENGGVTSKWLGRGGEYLTLSFTLATAHGNVYADIKYTK